MAGSASSIFTAHPRRLYFWLLCALLLLLNGASARAQSQQQYVYASVPVTTTSSQVVGFNKDAQTGALSLVNGSPFPDAQVGQAMAIDGLGHFLFVLNSSTNNISMYQIDSASGSLTEVLGSPFSMGPTENLQTAASSPVCLATEKSGQFLYVGYQFGNFPNQGAINQFSIDQARQQLLPLAIQPTTDIASSPIGMVIGTIGTVQYLYVGLGLNRASGVQFAGTNVYRIDPITGELTLSGSGTAGSNLSVGRSIAIDPQSRFFFDGRGTSTPAIDAALIAPDGTATTGNSTIVLTSLETPTAMLVDNGGKFLYVQQGGTAVVYSIDQTTGTLAAPPAPLSVLNFTPRGAIADPLGPYLYSLQMDGVHGFLIDPQSGALAELSGSPFGGALAQDGIAISGHPIQALSGPLAALFPASASFGAFPVGQSSNSQLITLTNTGDQNLSVTQLTVTGSNTADFAATPTCSVPTVLSPNSSCTVSIVFTPSAPGPRQAVLMLTDNGPGSPHSVPLTGTGVAPQPAITIAPISLLFPTTSQGSNSPAQAVALTSSGSATLHISSILPSGSNPGDFQIINLCSVPLPVNATCSVAISFSPVGAGQRTASIVISDDAPDSPQSVQLTGTGATPPPGTPAVKISTTNISFGAVTQGSAVGAQTVTLTSFGTASLHISSIVLGGNNPTDFTLANNCTAAAYAVNATCTLGVNFAPLATGARNATITITDDAPNSPQTIALSANVNAAFTIAPAAPGGNSATISAGQTATYSLQITPGPGFSGSAAWSCAGLPANSTCTAPTVQIAGASPIVYTINVATIASTLILAPPVIPAFPPLLISDFMLCLLCAGFLLLNRTQLRDRARLQVSFAVYAMLALMCFTAAACGGGSVAAPQSIPAPHTVGTPRGTSTLTLTPSVTTSTGTPIPGVPPVQLTLIVN